MSELKNVHYRMSVIKSELSKMKIPKSGHNKFSGFKYHELVDFMPFVSSLNEKHGVNVFTKILKHEQICVLTVVNADDKTDLYEVVIPYVDAEMLAKGGAPSQVDAIQRMGSTITYNRRYLFMAAYDITENDSVDASPIEDPKTPPPPVQVKPQPEPTITDAEKEIIEAINQFTTREELKFYATTLKDEQKNENVRAAYQTKIKTLN